MTSLIPLVAAFLPFLVWGVEIFLPYPYLIEEVSKVFLVLFITDIASKKSQIKIAAASGFLFALSESVFYLFNIALVGDLNTLFLRLAVTIPLHILTFLIILIPTFKNKWLIILGFVLAVTIHYSFNTIIGSILQIPH